MPNTVLWTLDPPQPSYFCTIGQQTQTIKKQESTTVDEVKQQSIESLKQRTQDFQNENLPNQIQLQTKLDPQNFSHFTQKHQIQCRETIIEEIGDETIKQTKNQKYAPFFQIQVTAKSQISYSKQILPIKAKPIKKSRRKTRSEKQGIKAQEVSQETEKQFREGGQWKRTILPNMYQLILAYLVRKQKSEEKVKWLFEKVQKPNKRNCHNYNIQRYYHYQSLLKEKALYCLNQEKFTLLKQIHDPLCRNYQLEEQMYYNKISRIILKEFVEKELLAVILQKEKSRIVGSEEEGEFYLSHVRMYRQLRKALQKTFTI